ncbi:MAG: hypothetical protein WBO17_01675 [Sphingorhabdus sp.]
MGMFGALVGAAIDRSDGDSGIKGAIIGAGLSKAASVLAPFAFTFAIGWVVQRVARAAWQALPETVNKDSGPVNPNG